MSDARKVDIESRRIIREDLLTNILVEAGAGSGKTQMLAERMAAGVATGAYQIEHMAAVTFTRKAASELRGRFHLALEKRSFRREAEGETRVRAALSNLERFFAGTIHSFCARLLRERPVESGVSPGFTELDEAQDLELRKRAWRDFITNLRSAGDPGMMALLETGVRPTDLDYAFSTICLHEDVTFPAGDAECPDPTRALKRLEKFWKELQKHLPSSFAPDTTCKIQKAARDFRSKFKVSQFKLDQPSVMAELLDIWDCESKITLYQWTENYAEQQRLKKLINGLHEAFCASTVTPYLSEWRQYVYRRAVTVLTRARAYAANERRRLNSLNYGDLLTLTGRVLRENGEVRRSLQQKYRHLFVDEFQDTDPVQAEIVFLLAAEEARSRQLPTSNSQLPREPVRPGRALEVGNWELEVDWRTVNIRSGALFVVGDPKQSIYRFRRADIEIYNLVRDRFSEPETGRIVTLTRNFRSVPELCDFANRVFATRFPDEPSQHSPKFAPLDPDVSTDDVAEGSGLFALTHTCDKQVQVLSDDAAKIARYIRSEVDARRRKYSDFLILTRKKRQRIGPYAQALEALNVPIEVSGAGAFGKSAEVDALTTLLRALADPQDVVSLIAVLRGPLFGVSDRELFAFKQSGGWFSIFATSEFGGDDVEVDEEQSGVAQAFKPASAVNRVRSVLSALRQYYRWTRLLPASAALERILEHTGYIALAATTPGGVEAGDLLHAMDRVRHLVEDGGSLSDTADMLEDDSDDDSEVESLPLEPGRSDVVRIMNLHKAKGLEADVVFLADPCGGFDPKVDVHIARTGDTPEGWFQVARRKDGDYYAFVLGEHRDWDAHKQAEEPYLKAEQDRLLYVAATRARKVLVVSHWKGKQRGAPAWAVLGPFLSRAEELPVPQSVTTSVATAEDCSAAAQVEANAAMLSAHERVKQASWSITSATGEAKHIARMTRTADAAADDPTQVVATNTPTHRADAGMAWGTLIHGLLEHAMRHPNSTPDDLRRLALWLTVDEPQLRSVIDEAIETVQRVAGAEFWAEAQRGEHEEEAPFAVVEGRALTNGVIDLLFKSVQGWQVRDYKTDMTLDAAAYATQLGTYREALKAVGCDLGGAELVSVRSTD